MSSEEISREDLLILLASTVEASFFLFFFQIRVIITYLSISQALIRYAECQKEDWKNHNTACRSLKGGTWRTISVKEPSGMPPFRWLVNRLGSLSSSTAGIDVSTDGKPLANIHHGKIVLAKFPLALAL